MGATEPDENIESIRPGGVLEASFAVYPPSDLLLGVLRANLTGRLEVFLHPEPRNRIFFKNGVPISVALRDTGVSLIQCLIESGDLQREVGLAVLQASEESGRDQESLIEEAGLLPRAALADARRRCARAQVIRLFDLNTEFRFLEGAECPEDALMTILQPLPLVFEGLRAGKNRSTVVRFATEHAGSLFSLSPTFPVGVDPFEWGAELDRSLVSLGEPISIERLVEAGVSRDLATAALASLSLAGMVELRERGSQPSAQPRKGRRRDPPPAADRPRDPSAPIGQGRGPRSEPKASEGPAGEFTSPLTGQELRPGPRMRALVDDLDEPTESTPVGFELDEASPTHEDQYRGVMERLERFEGLTYFRVLQVAPAAKTADIERAYRDRLDELAPRPMDAGQRAERGLLKEAYLTLTEEAQRREYQAAVESAPRAADAARAQRALEAELKIDRAFRLLGDPRRSGEVAYLLNWAERLDPTRADAGVLRLWLESLLQGGDAGGDQRKLEVRLQAALEKRPSDRRLKLCHAFVLARQGAIEAAKSRLLEARDAHNPATQQLVQMLAGQARADPS